MSNEIALRVRGQSYYGWTEVAVEKSLRQMSGSFGLSTTDKFPSEPRKWNIAMGDECVVEISGQRLITGYIEDILIDYTYNLHTIQFGGRDKTADLIDCSYDGTAKEWKGLSIAAVIRKVCEPFGIDIAIDPSVSKEVNEVWPDNIKANEGDTVFDLIFKVSRMKAILPVSYSDGKLTLTRAGSKYKAKDVLQTGVNILKGNLDQTNKDRYNSYIVKGQGVGNDNKFILGDFTAPTGKALDRIINRYRPIIIFTETSTDVGRCIERAKWEKNNRAGASRTLNYDVQGWKQSDGKVWPLNAMVSVKDEVIGVNSSFLISELLFTITELGSITKMRLVHPDAYTTKPDIPEIKSGFDWGPVKDSYE